jgi:hypothetical protein
MSIVEVKVPDIGDFKEVEVIELMVKPGDTIKVDQSLVTVESDKASMEIPSSHAGVVKEIKVKVGDKVAEGSLVLKAPLHLLPRRHLLLPLRRLLLPLRRLHQPLHRRLRPHLPAMQARPTHRHRSASSRANSASTCRACRAPARRTASRKSTCRTSSRA